MAYAAERTSASPVSVDTPFDKPSFVPPYILDENPVFTGGSVALKDYLHERFQYTELARAYGVEGRMVLRLFLDYLGKVTEVEILRGLGFGMDERVAEIFASMPGWEPGTLSGMPVATSMVLPLDFRLSP